MTQPLLIHRRNSIKDPTKGRHNFNNYDNNKWTWGLWGSYIINYENYNIQYKIMIVNNNINKYNDDDNIDNYYYDDNSNGNNSTNTPYDTL